MDVSTLRKISIFYLASPVVLFFFTWLRSPWSILFSSMLFAGVFFCFRGKDEVKNAQNEQYYISKPMIIFIFAFAILWCASIGIGGYVYQYGDFFARNAYFADLIQLSWPIYSTDGRFTLIYYLCFWLVPAMITKPFLYVFGFEAAWKIGNFLLLIWSAIGVSIAICWLASILRLRKTFQIVVLCFMFALFDSPIILLSENGISQSGGVLFTIIIKKYWHSGFPALMPTGPTIQMSVVFNQVIPIWIALPMLMSEKDLKNYGLIACLCLPYSPFAMVPIAAIMGTNAVMISIRTYAMKLLHIIKDVFSIQNILAFCSITPVFYFYFTSTPAAETFFQLSDIYILQLLEFCFFIFGIIAALIYIDCKRDHLFYASLLFLFISPFFVANNQALRVYYVPMFVLMIYSFRFVFNNLGVLHIPERKAKIRLRDILPLRSVLAILLCITLALGVASPISIYMVSYKLMIQGFFEYMPYSSSVNEDPGVFNLTVFETPSESIFYKYLAKRFIPVQPEDKG